MFNDSFDKIALVYFAAVAKRAFLYRGQLHMPKPLRVSTNIFRGYTCPSGCGGCCPRFALLYAPFDTRPYPMKARTIEINGRSLIFYEDSQTDHKDHHCRNLDKNSGRCVVHPHQPFTCDFELLRVHRSVEHSQLGQQLYGRGWNMLRVDGERGALCEMTPPTPEWVADTARRLKRLRQWAEYCAVETHLDAIIPWVESGPHPDPLFLEPEGVKR